MTIIIMNITLSHKLMYWIGFQLKIGSDVMLRPLTMGQRKIIKSESASRLALRSLLEMQRWHSNYLYFVW